MPASRLGRPAIGPRLQTRLSPEETALVIRLQHKRKLATQAAATRLLIQAGIEALRSRGGL